MKRVEQRALALLDGDLVNVHLRLCGGDHGVGASNLLVRTAFGADKRAHKLNKSISLLIVITVGNEIYQPKCKHYRDVDRALWVSAD